METCTDIQVCDGPEYTVALRAVHTCQPGCMAGEADCRTGGLMAPKTKLLDQMRLVLRLKHLSIRTEHAYIKRFP